MFLSDKLIFQESIIYFSLSKNDIQECWSSRNKPRNIIEIKCVLRAKRVQSEDNELEYIGYETIFKGRTLNNFDYRTKIKPFSIGYGKINGEQLVIQLLPTFNSPNANYVIPIAGTRIELKYVEPLLMLDL